jgi:molybdopterin synthase catalytic subunit
MSGVESPSELDWIALSPSPLSAGELIEWATRANCGAIVTFSGTVRNNSHDLTNVHTLEYEPLVDSAKERMQEVVAETRSRWPALGAIAVHHRVGRVELGETAVVVVVSAPHRPEAFAAAQFCIDAVKDCVPMWKKEYWAGGSRWSPDVHSLSKVQDR